MWQTANELAPRGEAPCNEVDKFLQKVRAA